MAFCHLFSLYHDRFVPIASYSKGMRQKVLLAAALLHNPDILLLDEPFSGLDINSALVLRCLVGELAARGKVILFRSHELEIVERVSSRIVILDKGRVAANDSNRPQPPASSAARSVWRNRIRICARLQQEYLARTLGPPQRSIAHDKLDSAVLLYRGRARGVRATFCATGQLDLSRHERA